MSDSAIRVDNWPTRPPAALPSKNGSTIEAIPAFRSIYEFLTETPSAEDLYTYEHKAAVLLGDFGSHKVEGREFADLQQARMNLVGFAHCIASGNTNFSELLDRRVLSLVATVARASKIRSPEVVYTKEQALKDYFSTLHLIAADAMLGRAKNGKQVYSFMLAGMREQFPDFITDLSNRMPRYEESAANLISLAEEHLSHIQNYGILFQELAKEVEALLRGPKTKERHKQIVDLFKKFYDIRLEATGIIDWVLIGPSIQTSNSISDSETAKLLKTEKRELLPLFAPSSSSFYPGTSMKDYWRELNAIQATTKAWPEYEPFVRQLLTAFEQDAVKIGEVINRKPGENDADYAKRVRPLLEINWTDTQKQLLRFVTDHPAYEDYMEVLAQISDLCGTPLKHADITPHVYAVADVVNELARSLKGHGRVIGGIPASEVVRTRILVRKEGTKLLEEYNFMTGEIKGIMDLASQQGCLIDYTPVNILNREQYRIFHQLMEAMHSRL